MRSEGIVDLIMELSLCVKLNLNNYHEYMLEDQYVASMRGSIYILLILHSDSGFTILERTHKKIYRYIDIT